MQVVKALSSPGLKQVQSFIGRVILADIFGRVAGNERQHAAILEMNRLYQQAQQARFITSVLAEYQLDQSALLDTVLQALEKCRDIRVR
jgi:hypothetical protein